MAYPKVSPTPALARVLQGPECSRAEAGVALATASQEQEYVKLGSVQRLRAFRQRFGQAMASHGRGYRGTIYASSTPGHTRWAMRTWAAN